MPMKSYPVTELARNSTEIRHDATRAPVTITERNKPRFVLMAIEDYEALTKRAEDPRRAFLLKDITAEDRALLERGLAAAAAEDDDA
jgi:prevent-host-death family protein